MIETAITIFLTFILSVLLPLNAQTYVLYKEAKSDALQLQQKLLLVHPAVETTEDKHRVKQQFKRLVDSLPDQIEVNDLYSQLAVIIDSIPCGHTSIRPPKFEKTSNDSYFPISCQYIEGKVIATKGKNNLGVPTAFELVSIENINIDTILTQLLQYQNATDEELPKSKKKNTVKKFKYLYNLFYPHKSSYTYVIKDVNSDLSITSITDKPNVNKDQKRIPIIYEYDEDHRIGKLDLNAFTGYGAYQLVYKIKINSIFKQIEEQGIEKLIIDLRGNGGGAAANMSYVLKHLLIENFKSSKELRGKRGLLKDQSVSEQLLLLLERKDKDHIYLDRYCKTKRPKKKNRFDGELVVLVDEGTFSAASLFASIIKSKKRGRLIGSVTGGNFDHTYGGFFDNLKLKNSRIRLRYPLFKVMLDVDEQLQEKGTNLCPDIYIEQTIDDYILGKDMVLEKAYEMLK